MVGTYDESVFAKWYLFEVKSTNSTEVGRQGRAVLSVVFWKNGPGPSERHH